MTVFVEFPDGLRREVPGQLRALSKQHFGNVMTEFEQVPLNCDPCWKYERKGAHWVAVPRKGQLLPLRSQTPAWWQFVELMLEPERRSSAAAFADEVTLQSAA